MQREVRHVEHSLIHATASLEQRDALIAQHAAHHVEREFVMPGGHRCVRGEDAPLAHRLEVCVFELEMLASTQLFLQQLKGEERRVPFVQMVDHAGVVSERLEQTRTPHAEHDLLTQAIVLISAVERIGERTVPLAVLRQIRVEQKDRHLVIAHALYGVLPRGDLHRASFDRH